MKLGAIVKSGILHCTEKRRTLSVCKGCPYYSNEQCTQDLMNDALLHIKYLETKLEQYAGKLTDKGFLTTDELIDLYSDNE